MSYRSTSFCLHALCVCSLRISQPVGHSWSLYIYFKSSAYAASQCDACDSLWAPNFSVVQRDTQDTDSSIYCATRLCWIGVDVQAHHHLCCWAVVQEPPFVKLSLCLITPPGSPELQGWRRQQLRTYWSHHLQYLLQVSLLIIRHLRSVNMLLKCLISC